MSWIGKAAIVILLLGAAQSFATVTWPDTVQVRDSGLYYVAKVDTVGVSQKTEGDVTTIQHRVDTLMAKRIPINIHFDNVMMSLPEMYSLGSYFYQRVKGDTAAFHRGWTVTGNLPGGVSGTSKKGKK
jgi:hypothetical protein